MTSKFSVVFAALAVIVTIAAPLSAQSLRLTANVPFEFTVSNKTLPAGDYSVLSASEPYILRIQNDATNTGALAMTGSAGDYSGPGGQAKLVFNRYGNHYFLAQVWGGYSGIGHQLPRTRSERELAKTASMNRLEIVAMLMPR